MKYVKIWMGFVTGSMAGRNDGFPERKHRFYETKETLLQELGKHSKDETIYALEELDMNKLIEEREQLRREKEEAELLKSLESIRELGETIKDEIDSFKEKFPNDEKLKKTLREVMKVLDSDLQ